MLKRLVVAVAVVTLFSSRDVLDAWGGQGHRLVGLIAAERLTPVAKQTVQWLLDGQTLADVSSWADSITGEQVQTSYWHYLNIPPEATAYDRDRDCPRQPGVAAGSRGDRWRDCAVDRIAYWEERLGNPRLDRADRATALKFVVHFIGDLHQPFHALGVGRGGNDVTVSVFGEKDCGASTTSGPARAEPRAGTDSARSFPCNLHSVWDSRLIARRNLDDPAYVAALRQLIGEKRLAQQPPGTPAEWAEQSFRLAKEALVKVDANIDEGYYRRHIVVINERLALGGIRLAASLNRLLTN
ncbi:MAG TPA: S1/P1 nuclease [Vicinamibacterales bacterium]|nr:S1/P1 nuclease [Vicinamibacterales bacterium]